MLLVGFRVGLNTEQSGVLDVGYAGVIGADRLAHGETPYGNFPVRDTGRPCGPATEDGDVGDWVQANGRCETANHLGDTYGPVNYHAYLPGLRLFGWSGKWDGLPAVHFTTIFFDLLAILGLTAVGFRFGGARLAALLAFAWAANPFTQYVSSSNTNDAIMPVFLIWGFWAASSNLGRGIFAALGAWTKLAALVVAPLWATYPNPRDYRRATVFAAAFTVTTVFVLLDTDPQRKPGRGFSGLLRADIRDAARPPFDPSPRGGTGGSITRRASPISSGYSSYCRSRLSAPRSQSPFVPRRKSPLQLAALTAALLMGFELVLTHWAALYIAWFFPFLALAVVAGSELGGVVPERARAAPAAPSGSGA